MSEELQSENTRLRAELASLRDELAAAQRKSAQALAGYQQHALNMEIIRQQNEDLTLITQELATAKAAEEQHARELESAIQKLRERFLRRALIFLIFGPKNNSFQSSVQILFLRSLGMPIDDIAKRLSKHRNIAERS